MWKGALLPILDIQFWQQPLAVSLGMLCLLYLAFRTKQLLCDYVLQSAWMALGKARETGWLAPLAVHAALHASGTLLIVLIFAPALWWLGVVDFILHAAIDRAKVVVLRRRQWTPKHRFYWWAYGLDQEAHNLSHFAYILAILLL